MTLQLWRLRLRNVRSYDAAELSLTPGVTVLTGDVGSGKTSLLHAIEMALFGFAEVEGPYLVRHRSGEASVALTLTDDEHTYELARTFRRKTRRGREVFDPDEPTFRVDGELRRYSATEFRQRVINLLGFPDNPNPRSRSDLWRWAVYTPQERMREILNVEEADARLETIRKALGLERYRRAADNAEVVAAALRAESRSHADVALGLRHFESDLERAEAATREATLKVEGAEASAAHARRISAETEELLARSEADRRRREADRRQRDLLHADDARLAADAEASHRRAEAARSEADEQQREATRMRVLPEVVADARAALEAEEEELQRRREDLARYEALTGKTGEAERLVSTLRGSIAELDRRRPEESEELANAVRALATAEARGPTRAPAAPTPRTLDAISADLDRLRAEERTAVDRASARNAEATEIVSLLTAGICPRCHQTVAPEEFRTHRAEAERAAEEAWVALDSVRALVTAAEAERGSRERYERAAQSWMAREELRTAADAALQRLQSRAAERAHAQRGLAEQLQTAESALRAAREAAAPFEQADKKLRRAETARDEARATLVAREGAVARSEALAAAAAVARGHAGSEAEREREAVRRRGEVRASLASLEESLRDAPQADRAHAELAARREAARARELQTHAELTAANERQRFAEERRTDAQRGVEERRQHLVRSEELARVGDFLAGTFRDALLDLERRLLGRAQALFERSFARAFTALVEDPGLVARCGPSFVPYVEIDGDWTPADALSGGERTALALAFRLALGEVVRSTSRLRLDTVILDEPTDGFSPEQVGRMGELLRSLPWGQVLVVTHEASLAAIADRSVRVRKVDGRSILETDGAAPTPESDEGAPKRRRRGARLDVLPPVAR